MCGSKVDHFVWGEDDVGSSPTTPTNTPSEGFRLVSSKHDEEVRLFYGVLIVVNVVYIVWAWCSLVCMGPLEGRGRWFESSRPDNIHSDAWKSKGSDTTL